jgi:hypothetical protein
MSCHSRRWGNWSIPSYVCSCTGFFGIGNTLFKRIFAKVRVSTDVYGMELGLIQAIRIAQYPGNAAGSY